MRAMHGVKAALRRATGLKRRDARQVRERWIVFGVGAVGYSMLEVLWRGYTHWTMALTGGVCFQAIYAINRRLRRRPWPLRCALGAAVITGAELAVGLVVNERLRMRVWDYSRNRLNFRGQICALYSALWFLLCIPLGPFCAWLRRRIA